MTLAPVAPTVESTRGGKYLTFYLGDEEYGVAIMRVQEIIGLQPITRVPRTPAFMRGVINLRGKVIPVVELRERFGMLAPDAATAGEYAAETAAALRCIIVVEVAMPIADDARVQRISMGLMVDRVSEVAPIAEDDIEDAPSFGPGVRTDYLLGIAKSRGAHGNRGAAHTGGDAGRVRLLLDLDRVLATDEMEQLPSADA
ncbi:MAG TPA: chemotaxis protein CheW [Gemmatirosa sp.]